MNEASGLASIGWEKHSESIAKRGSEYFSHAVLRQYRGSYSLPYKNTSIYYLN